MSQKWRSKTEEHKEKIRQAMLKNWHKPPSQKWAKRSVESRKKLSDSKRWKKLWPHSEETKRKIWMANKWRKASPELRKKLSEVHIWLQAKEKHPLWKWWISSKNSEIRSSIEYKLWRNSVFARDAFLCIKCWIDTHNNHAHHVINFNSHPELRFAIDNWVTMCKHHHELFHKIYWNKNNNREQLNEFISFDEFLMS